MSRPVTATNEETDHKSQVSFRLLHARHRSALRALAKSHGLSIHEQAREILEGSLERSDGKDAELLRLEVEELRLTVEQMRKGMVQVLAGILSLTPNAEGERMNLKEAKNLVSAAFGEFGKEPK